MALLASSHRRVTYRASLSSSPRSISATINKRMKTIFFPYRRKKDMKNISKGIAPANFATSQCIPCLSGSHMTSAVHTVQGNNRKKSVTF